MILAIPSPSGELLATTTVADNGRRVTIRAVRRELRVQSTLRRSDTAASSPFTSSTSIQPTSRLAWLSETLVATLGMTEQETVLLTVFDVTRGVVAYTLEYGSGGSTNDFTDANKNSNNDNNNKSLHYSFVDWTVVGGATTGTTATTAAGASAVALVVAVTTRKQKCVLLVYHGATGKLERKIKAGQDTRPSGSGGGTLAVAANLHLAAWRQGGNHTTNSSIRVTSLRTGEKVAKVPLTSPSSGSGGGSGGASRVAAPTPVLAVAGHVGCATTNAVNDDDDDSLGQSVWVLFDMTTGRILQGEALLPTSATTVPTTTTTTTTVQLVQSALNESYWLLLNSTTLIQFTTHIRSNNNNNSEQIEAYDIRQTRPLQLPSKSGTENDTDWSYQYHLTPTRLIVTRYNGNSSSHNIKNNNNNSSTLINGGLQLCSIELDSVSNDNDGDATLVQRPIVLFGSSHDDQTHDSAVSGTKRKPSNALVILGPGQAGGEAHGVTEAGYKRLKRDTDLPDNNADGDDNDDGDTDTNPTIAERLIQLQQVLDEEDYDDDDDDIDEEMVEASTKTKTSTTMVFVTRHATTESLTHILSQALQSSDSVMLEQALAVRDANMLRESCRALAAPYAVSLLQALTMRLATKPARADQLVPWIAAILQSNHVQNLEQLQPLQNLLQERLEVFPLLLQLEGRLEHMTTL